MDRHEVTPMGVYSDGATNAVPLIRQIALGARPNPEAAACGCRTQRLDAFSNRSGQEVATQDG
jgi:hypothetical protein